MFESRVLQYKAIELQPWAKDHEYVGRPLARHIKVDSEYKIFKALVLLALPANATDPAMFWIQHDDGQLETRTSDELDSDFAVLAEAKGETEELVDYGNLD